MTNATTLSITFFQRAYTDGTGGSATRWTCDMVGNRMFDTLAEARDAVAAHFRSMRARTWDYNRRRAAEGYAPARYRISTAIKRVTVDAKRCIPSCIVINNQIIPTWEF